MDAHRVAAEHVAWCASQGEHPAQVMEAVGLPWRCARRPAGWDDARLALVVAQFRMRGGSAAG